MNEMCCLDDISDDTNRILEELLIFACGIFLHLCLLACDMFSMGCGIFDMACSIFWHNLAHF